jgi:hypothetical protein
MADAELRRIQALARKRIGRLNKKFYRSDSQQADTSVYRVERSGSHLQNIESLMLSKP